MSPPAPPRRPGSSPELQGIVTPDQPERGAVRHHPGLEGAPVAPRQRTQTLPGIPRLSPPALPRELAKTERAPSTTAQTVRATPSAGIEAQRSQTPVSGQPAQPLPPPSLHPAEAQAAAYKRRAEEAEKQLAEQRAAKASEAPASGNAVLSDEHIGRFVREVTRVFLRRIGAPAALVAMLGGGGYALKASHDKPAPPPLTAQQLDERLEKFEGKVVSRLDKLTTTTNEGIDLQRCLRKKVGQIGGSLLPAVDRMGAALKQQPFDDDCPDSPKRLPEPKPQ